MIITQQSFIFNDKLNDTLTIIIEHESHEFHELFRADDTSIHLQVTVATATENL